MVPFIVCGFLGFLLIDAAVHGKHPLSVVAERFGGTAIPLSTPPDPNASSGASGQGGITFPGRDICNHPPALVTRGGVTLEPAAMAAFQRAQAASGNRINVVSSYRSCTQQAEDCARICGEPQRGCPGRCAPPGTSKHQYGDAVDVSNWQSALAYLTVQGWCHPLPGSDPGHFSYAGCG